MPVQPLGAPKVAVVALGHRKQELVREERNGLREKEFRACRRLVRRPILLFMGVTSERAEGAHSYASAEGAEGRAGDHDRTVISEVEFEVE